MPRSETIFMKTQDLRPPMRLFHPGFLFLLLCLSAGCLMPIASTVADSPKDPVISTNVEAKLAEDQQGGLAGILVTTENGIVTLTGTVQKAERKAKAAELARQVKGVKRVKNDLDIHADSAP